MTLTPKDCLYIEDSINASVLLNKQLNCEMEKLEDEQAKELVSKICTTLKEQAEELLKVMEG